MVIPSLIIVQLYYSKTLSDKKNMEKSSFLARMSHEIRTPMNSIIGIAELLKREDVSREIREYVEIISQSGNNLLAIINDILDFSRIESGRLEIQNRDYNINSVVSDMINMVRPRVAEKSLDFFVNVDSAIPDQLFGDDIRLRQILTNLISNAVKYTRSGFISLQVEMEKIDNNTLKLICTVEDSGIGIKTTDQGRLFQEFARIDTKINQDIEGTGLGLVITVALCKAMDGGISVSSEYGKGSVFKAVVTQTCKNEEPSAIVYNAETKKVLFYDWRQQYVKSISNALEGLGVKYTCPSAFKEFLYELQHGSYDFAFISSRHAMDCIHISEMRITPLHLVLMVEPGEVSMYKDVTSILMPVYSITIANVLNTVFGETLSHYTKHRTPFTAPSAKVLIVDDISINLIVAKELMTPYNMQIETCLSGPEAIAILEKERYDIVFMDHMMPGMDGIETTTLIRNLEGDGDYYRTLPIIALTANVISGQKEVFLENGIDDFLGKPIDMLKLNEILEKWLPAEKRVVSVQGQHVDDEKIDLPDINGLNVPLGLRNCGGNMPTFLNILEDFCRDAEERLVQIEEAVSGKDAKAYIALLHALKGVTLSIGAMETGEKASWLEETAESTDLTLLKDKTAELKENVQTLVGNIRLALEQREPESNHKPAENIGPQLENLKAALTVMDVEAINRILLTVVQSGLDDRTRALVSELEQCILLSDYEKAVEKIDALL